MKQLQFVLVSILFSTLLFSCSKQKDAPEPVYVVEGLYSGKTGSGTNPPSSQFALHLKSGGAMERVNGNGVVSGVGTWQISGTAFTGHYSSVSNSTEVDLTGTLEKTQKRISGTWTTNNGTNGTFDVTKE